MINHKFNTTKSSIIPVMLAFLIAAPACTTQNRINSASGAVSDSVLLNRQETQSSTSAAVKYDPSEVLEIQRLLYARGFDPGIADGIYGPNTSRAISAFKEATNVQPADGTITPGLLAQIETFEAVPVLERVITEHAIRIEPATQEESTLAAESSDTPPE